MSDNLTDAVLVYSQFSSTQLVFASACCFIAGAVRGFAGFALSALIMSSLVVILPPIQLLPICYFMELLAGLIMTRASLKSAKLSAVAWLILGSIIGVPLGVFATTHMPVDLSRNIVLVSIIFLAVAQLLVRLPNFAVGPVATTATGVVAGIFTGLAHVGGMLVALFVLAQNLSPAVTRATLVLFLLAGSLTTGISLFVFDIFSAESLWRSMLLAPAVAAGVLFGGVLFNPALLPYYRRFCLMLVIFVAVSGLIFSLLWHA